MARKLWSELAPRTKRRYAAQGVSPQRYNASLKRGLRGAARLEYLGVRPGSISGRVPTLSAFTVIERAILGLHPDGRRRVHGKPSGPIKFDKVEARTARQTNALKRLIVANADADYLELHELLAEHEDFNPDDNPLWYND